MHSRTHSHTTGAQDKDEDYSEFGDDEHINKALLLQGYLDLYAIWKEAGAINTTDFDILYAAGITDDGLEYLRDRRLPDKIKVRMSVPCKTCDGQGWYSGEQSNDPMRHCNSCDGTGKELGEEVEVEYDFLWWFHETSEQGVAEHTGRIKKILCNQLYKKTRDEKWLLGNVVRINYRVAHQCAEAGEYALVDAMGLDRDSYTKACDELIKIVANAPLEKSPGNLDLYPYEDEKDLDALQAIVDSGGPESELLREVGQAPGDSGKPYNHGD